MTVKAKGSRIKALFELVVTLPLYWEKSLGSCR